MMASVNREMRHTKEHRCEVCGGADGDPRGKDKRCMGFTSADRVWCHCSREEQAGGIQANGAGLYAHIMRGPCNCGSQHGPAFDDGIVREYDYRDANGELVFQVIRKTDKQFRQRKPDGAGGWIWKLEGVQRVLYLLPELLEADPTAPVLIVEGEKDVETARELGFVATCNPGGAGKWSAVAESAIVALSGRDCVVMADRDGVGESHAVQVAAHLRAHAKSVKVVAPPDPHKDLSDWVQAGATVADVMRVITAEPTPDHLAKTQPELAVLQGGNEAPKAKPNTWKWRTSEEIFFGPPRPAQWIVKDLGLCPGRPAILSGPSGGAKTIVLQALLMSLATGRRVWEHFEGAGELISCAHVDVDLGEEDVEHRYRRLLAGWSGAPILQEDIGGRIILVSFPEPEIDLMQVSARKRLREELGDRKIKLCGIDALRGIAHGDENSSEFRRALDCLTAVGKDIGCTFIALHHTGLLKMGPNGKPIQEDDDKAGRGSSSIKDAAGVIWKITGDSRKGRRIHMAKPPGRTGVQWDGKFDIRIIDVPDTEIEGAKGMRVIVSAEVKKTADEIGDQAVKDANARANFIRETFMRIVKVAGSEGFKGGIDALVTRGNDAIRSGTGKGIGSDTGRKFVAELILEEKIFVVGKGPATRITVIKPTDQTEMK